MYISIMLDVLMAIATTMNWFDRYIYIYIYIFGQSVDVTGVPPLN